MVFVIIVIIIVIIIIVDMHVEGILRVDLGV